MNVPLLLLVLLFSVVVHECAHGWAADRLGDPTARLLGRLTLNPLRHIDPVGTIIVPLVLALIPGGLMFGWARPVPVDHSRLRRPRRDAALVAAAGPGSNLLLAAICAIAWGLLAAAGLDGRAPGERLGEQLVYFATQLLMYGVYLNVLLALFNLIPLPPLDGSWIVQAGLRREAAAAFIRLRPFGFLLVIVLLNTGLGRWFHQAVLAVVAMFLALGRAIPGLVD